MNLQQATEIRKRHIEDGLSAREIAEASGLAYDTVYRIVTYRTWTALTPEEEALVEATDFSERPQTYGDCPKTGPCPWVSCRHHNYLDVSETGRITINYPGIEPDELEHPCSLRVATTGAQSLDALQEIWGLDLRSTAYQRVNLALQTAHKTFSEGGLR